MHEILEKWEIAKDDAPTYRQLAERALQEVTHLTEYQDEKANRILTAMAFLSALAGVLFVGFVDHQRPHLLGPGGGLCSVSHWCWLATAYLLMMVYCLFLTSGAALVVWGIKPRFNVPKTWTPSKDRPASFLFFAKILDVSPEVWARAFRDAAAPRLEAEFAKDAVRETYLVAGKLRTKLSLLEPGLFLLFLSTVVLGVWCICVLGVVVSARPCWS